MKISQILENQAQEQLDEINWSKVGNVAKTIGRGVTGAVRGVGDVAGAVAGGVGAVGGGLVGGINRGWNNEKYQGPNSVTNAPQQRSQDPSTTNIPQDQQVSAQQNAPAATQTNQTPAQQAPAQQQAQAQQTPAQPQANQTQQPSQQAPQQQAPAASTQQTAQADKQSKIGVGQINKIIPTLRARDLQSLKKNLDTAIAQKTKAEKQPAPATKGGAGAFGQMANQLGNTGQSSTGGQTQGTATGLKHTANPNNPNLGTQQAPADTTAQTATGTPLKVQTGGKKPKAAAPKQAVAAEGYYSKFLNQII
jgi:hypothetical protein